MKHINIEIFGRVQGVFFRESAAQKAQELDVRGTVKNTDRNSVYIEIEGEDTALEKFLEWCSKGPKDAFVEHIKIMRAEPKNYTDFKVID